MSDAHDDVKAVIRTVNRTDYERVNGEWFGYMLADLSLALSGQEILHVDWDAAGKPDGKFSVKIVVFTEKLVIQARYAQNGPLDGRDHDATVWSRRDFTSIDISGTNSLSNYDGVGTVSVVLTRADGKWVGLPLNRADNIAESLSALVPSLLEDLTR